VAVYGNGLRGLVKHDHPISIVTEHPDEPSATQITELVTVSNTSSEKRLQLAALMFFAELGYTRHGIKNPVFPLKEYEPNVGLANHSIATSDILLFIHRVKVIGYNQIGEGPNIRSGSVAVVLGPNLVNKASITTSVNLQRGGFNRS
jgi:hypothetical protein